MRKIFAVSAIALLAFAGQAVASEGVATLSPDLGRIGFASSDGADSQDNNNKYGYIALGALVLIGGAIALATSGGRHRDSGQSA